MINLRHVMRAVAVASLVALTGGCTTNPATGERNFTPFMTPAQETQIGAQEHPKIVAQYGVYQELPGLNAYIADIAFRIHGATELANEPFTITLLDNGDVNAFATPGGYIYIDRGLVALANNEAELAGVIGHEMGHVTARHAAQRETQQVFAGLAVVALGIAVQDQNAVDMANVGAQAWVSGYSRDQESQADELGIRYMTRAGYDPRAMSTFLQALGNETALEQKLAFQDGSQDPAGNLFSTHPRTADRVAAAAELARVSVANPRVAHDEYLRHLDGMIYGDSPEQGYVRGRVFAHPKLRLTFEVPQGFRIINGNDNVVALNKDGAMIQFDADKAANGVAMTSYMTNQWITKYPVQNLERISINGMEAATGTLRLQGQNGPVDVRPLAIRWDANTVYRFLFISPANQTASLARSFRETTYSFRRLSASEAAALKPLRIRIVTVGAGDTIDSLASRMAFDDLRRERFMTLNGITSNADLRPGMLVKIVVKG